LLEFLQIPSAFRYDRIVEMVRHLAQSQYMDVVLACHDAVLGEIRQVIDKRIKQYASANRPLTAVIQYAPDENPSLHISQQLDKSENRTGYEVRKDFLEKQIKWAR
jgi:Sec7-like guanine-nucleotide exchange factor